MPPRITLDQSPADGAVFVASSGKPVSRPFASRDLVRADWNGPTSETLMLYLAGEPRIGDEFSYNDLRWRVVDYRDGWVAELVVR